MGEHRKFPHIPANLQAITDDPAADRALRLLVQALLDITRNPPASTKDNNNQEDHEE